MNHLSKPSLAVLTAAMALAPNAKANPRPLPFTYIYETLAQGDVELEQYVDFTPVRAYSANGDLAWYGATQYQTEFEYGITHRLELGLYFTVAPPSSAYTFTPAMPSGNGFKQRLRYRFADVGQWPIDIAVYGEIAENEREIELEGKLILQRHFGPVRLVANAWVEREFYYSGEPEWVLNPTAGAVVELSPSVQVGAEYWMRAEFGEDEEPRTYSQGPNHFLGPTLMLGLGKLWWTTGAYARLNDFNRTALVGDNSGAFWFRTIVGVGL